MDLKLLEEAVSGFLFGMFHRADSGERKKETAESVSKFSERMRPGPPYISIYAHTYLSEMFWRLDIVSTTRRSSVGEFF
jgi:hypothetical protein